MYTLTVSSVPWLLHRRTVPSRELDTTASSCGCRMTPVTFFECPDNVLMVCKKDGDMHIGVVEDGTTGESERSDAQTE
jgi:hypothetical protein